MDTDHNNYPKNIEKELEKQAYILEGEELIFPKATIDPRLSHLQKSVTEFITSVILKHEKELYDLISQYDKQNTNEFLCTTNSKIIDAITLMTNKFFNDLYRKIQDEIQTPLSKLILEMCKFADYGPHILLDKLIRLVISIHLDINREQLALDDDYNLYEKSLLNQINICILSYNLLHMLSIGPDENIPFNKIPEGQNAFNIVIDKNISI
ncbi:hypothetical protein H012_gp715 [Acanthamoeba polyphaga moumouvirus]|uniref:Uncharacterized protein n=1 Tax=Acanthamoeba polyphaga moumouvirus TaxID=1269028 RepID=L7RFU1_9VIRU|nr:hypothetical protein H012_gp715 [Acanthamoeba polyphaga moumouvirus]AGC01750.1 hypothetical protein Moumou_00206 [Acanthamoeba polyphaga moumouvirus]